jgi:hypothetical protein
MGPLPPQISDEGVGVIASALVSNRLHSLRRLSLDHNMLGDDGMDALAAALEHGVPLQELYVECNPASDAATRSVLAFFGQEEEERERPPQTARSACEKVAVSCHKGLGDGCVCQ